MNVLHLKRVPNSLGVCLVLCLFSFTMAWRSWKNKNNKAEADFDVKGPSLMRTAFSTPCSALATRHMPFKTFTSRTDTGSPSPFQTCLQNTCNTISYNTHTHTHTICNSFIYSAIDGLNCELCAFFFHPLGRRWLTVDFYSTWQHGSSAWQSPGPQLVPPCHITVMHAIAQMASVEYLRHRVWMIRHWPPFNKIRTYCGGVRLKWSLRITRLPKTSLQYYLLQNTQTHVGRLVTYICVRST